MLLFASTILSEIANCRKGTSFCSDRRQQEFNSINLFLVRTQIQHNYEDFFPKQIPLLRNIFIKHPSRSWQRASIVSCTAAGNGKCNPGQSTPSHPATSPPPVLGTPSSSNRHTAPPEPVPSRNPCLFCAQKSPPDTRKHTICSKELLPPTQFHIQVMYWATRQSTCEPEGVTFCMSLRCLQIPSLPCPGAGELQTNREKCACNLVNKEKAVISTVCHPFFNQCLFFKDGGTGPSPVFRFSCRNEVCNFPYQLCPPPSQEGTERPCCPTDQRELQLQDRNHQCSYRACFQPLPSRTH